MAPDGVGFVERLKPGALAGLGQRAVDVLAADIAEGRLRVAAGEALRPLLPQELESSIARVGVEGPADLGA